MSKNIINGLTALAIASISLITSQAAAADNKSLVVCVANSPSSLNPNLVFNGPTNNMIGNNVYNTLFQFDQKGEKVTPALATEYRLSEDGKTVTLKLREGVKFQSNKYFKPTRDFNADDVIFTLDRLLNENNKYRKVSDSKYPVISAMGINKLIASYKKINKNTVEITLTKPDVSFKSTLAMSSLTIGSKEYADKVFDRDPTVFDTNPIGTGPFYFQQYRTDQSVRLARFNDYWGGKADVESLIYSITPDALTRLSGLQTGSCDIVEGIGINEIDRLKKDPKVNVVSNTGLNVAYISFNTEKPPLDNVEVRQAIKYAIDGAAIKKIVYQNTSTLDDNLLAPLLIGYDPFLKSEYNPKKAKELLSKAGYKDGFDLEFLVQPYNGQSNPDNKKTAELIQSDLAKVGIKVKLKNVDRSQFGADSRAGNFQIATHGWSGDNGDTDNFFRPLLGSEAIGSTNRPRLNSPELDALIAQGSVVLDVNKRSEIYKKASRLVSKLAPIYVVGHSTVFAATNKRVENFVPSQLGYSYVYPITLK